MKPFEDMLPEEKEPQHEELRTLLQRAYRKPVIVSLAEQAQIITQVRERLMKTDLGDSLNEDMPVPQVGVLDSSPRMSVPQVGVLDSSPRMPVIHAGILRRDGRRFRLIALLAAALVITVLLGTPLLILRFSSTSGTVGLPTLTLSSNAASIGDTVTLRLKYFSHSASVALTHDIQERIQINGGSSITTNSEGVATVPFVIDTHWGPGFHLIVAEDVATRYTASATLQITTGAPTPPPHLLIDTSTLNMGSAFVGENTIQTLKLVNSGGGSITWSASSNQSWLLVSPSQGTFSQNQTISIAVQRLGLKSGDYNNGVITITSNVSIPQHIEVDMTVRPLPLNPGPVLALSPALISFTTTDGGSNPVPQSLTVNNPGSRPLDWSLAVNAPATATTQVSPTQAQGLTCNWLSVSPTRGTVPPGANRVLIVNVHSQCLLPGTYLNTLKFTGNGAIVGAQTVNVSLTVQPHCGLVTSTGYLAFTAVQGQNSRENQTLSLNATASCAGTPISWTTSSTVSWLTISPASGQLKGTVNTLVSIKVNARSLAPGIHSGDIFFVTGQSTLTVMVQLTVQAAPPLTAPIMGASPLSLNFSNTQGQPNPTGQVVTITNNGRSLLQWNTNVNCLVSCWWGASPTGGTIAPGQTGQLTIKVNTAPLTPGNYVGQITLNGFDSKGVPASGSPQTITINLVVQPPCSISPPSSSSLSFSAVQGAASNPASQTVMFTGWGSCVWPVTWNTSVAPTASWLALTGSTGSIKGTGQSGSIGVAANIAGLPAGTYATQVTIAASDASGGAVQGSLQTFTVTLTVLPPCALSPPSPASLAFSAQQGQTTSTALNVTLSETGTCTRPITWTATGDAGSSSWLVLATTSGTDSGSGSALGVNVTAANVQPGTYTGTITITATDSSGVAVSGSGKTMSVTLTVTGYTISGTIFACPGSTPPTCSTPQALPGATVTLMSSSTTVATTTADASGNYSFLNIPLGSYIITVSGTDARLIHYIGSATLTLSGNTTGFNIQAFPG